MARWQELAACNGLDPNIFVPSCEGRGGKTRSTYKEARKHCQSCLVIEQCLNFALTENMEFGMYGGMTPRERKRIRRVFVVAAS